jgi:tripartite-type tricarboxylate transporter receptor subunit TctC
MLRLARPLVGSLIAVAAMSLPGLLTSVVALEFPTKPLVWVLPSAGTVSDNTARFMAPLMAERFGQPVIVDNRPGAGGIISFEVGAAAKPDGYTILFGTSGPIATYPFIQKKLSYDPVRSYEPIHGFGASPLVLAVNNSSSFETFRQLVDYAKAHPDRLNFASVGVGSAQHLTTVLMMQNAGISLTHIPYKATSTAVTDLLGGTIDLMFDFASVLRPQIEAGKLRALGVSGQSRLPSLSKVPTFAESGYPGINFNAWSVLLAPAGTPPQVVDKISRVFEAVLKDPRVVKYHEDLGATLMSDMGPRETRDYIVAETAKMKELVARAGIKPE